MRSALSSQDSNTKLVSLKARSSFTDAACAVGNGVLQANRKHTQRSTGIVKVVLIAISVNIRVKLSDEYRTGSDKELLLIRSAGFVATIVVAQLLGCAAPGTYFVDSGSGEPVVLLHGFSQTHAAWLSTPLYDGLARDYRVIAVDLRGHGDSDKPHDPMSYGPNLHSDLIDLLDRLDIGKAHFVGFSLGANVVGDILVSRPERVRTATMASGLFTTWDESEEEFAKLTENRSGSVERYPWEPEDQDYRALAALVRGARYSVVNPEQIASIRTPTLVAFGGNEIEVMSEQQKQQLANLPSSVSVLIIDRADHDSESAAVLSPRFTEAAIALIASHPIP